MSAEDSSDSPMECDEPEHVAVHGDGGSSSEDNELMTPPHGDHLQPSPNSAASCSPQVSPTSLSPVVAEGVSSAEEQSSDFNTEYLLKEDEDSDPSRSEGTIRFTIPNLSQIQGTLLSEPCMVRDLPWRVMAMQRNAKSNDGQENKCLGIFVQCCPEAHDTPGWSVSARARITIINHKRLEKSHSKEIFHWYTARENDWGYANFIPWQEALDPELGFLCSETGSVTIHARVCADAPHGINWDSKKHTGFVGLKNQGATCYMNSLLQTLFCTNLLRKAVYQMPTDSDDSNRSVAYALQRLFYDLQHSDKSVGTKKLTKSFGWDSMDTFMQHDVQELSRVLIDNMQNKMKGTSVEDCIPKLLEGKMETSIKCTDIEYESRREEAFFDLQLNVKGNKSLYESFKNYTSPETLDGDNKYLAGSHGMQKAVRKVSFVKLPPVLHLQLMRFQFDMYSEGHSKINDRYEFPEHLSLDPFLKEQESTPAQYTLHAVLVHTGDNFGGHYVAYISPKGDGKWLKFDDDVVSKCTAKEAIDSNFGSSEDAISIRNCTSAYMLCYIRDSTLNEVLLDVPDTSIPDSLVRRISDEKKIEAIKRKERSEAHLYLTIEVYTDEDLQLNHGPGLLDLDDMKGRSFKIPKATLFQDMQCYIATVMGFSKNQIRVWPFERRTNHTYRPAMCENQDKIIAEAFESKSSNMKVFVETIDPDRDVQELQPFDFQTQVLFFIKYYDPYTQCVTYLGHTIESIYQAFEMMFPKLRAMAGLHSNDIPLVLFEEISPSRLDRINPSTDINQVDEVKDGDIICFQRADLPTDDLEIPNAPLYYREMFNRIDVIFYDKTKANDPGFTVTLNQKMNYVQMAKAVGAYLNINPYLIQFFRPQVHRHLSDQAIRCTNEGCVKDFVVNRSRTDSIPYLFYQKLDIPINEFETKRWFKCIYVNTKLQDENELTIYVDKNGTVDDLLNEAKNEITFANDSTRKLRLLEVMGYRITDIFSYDKPVSELVSQRCYRIEEIRSDELNLSNDEALIAVGHYYKIMTNTFGTPFLMRLKNGERLLQVKERVQNMLDIPEKEIAKWSFTLVSGLQIPTILSEELNSSLYINMFGIRPSEGIMFPPLGTPWLGLDHTDKNPKRSRYGLERSIKIHN